MITGRCQVKGGKIQDWVFANYSIGERAWLMRWHQLVMTTPPMIRDSLIPNYLVSEPGLPQWDSKQRQPAVFAQIYKSTMEEIAREAEGVTLDRAEAEAWARDSTPHWLRSAVPTMGGLKNHHDRRSASKEDGTSTRRCRITTLGRSSGSRSGWWAVP